MTIAQTNERHTLHRREPLLYVFLRDDRYACRAEEHVSASVIKVPMGIHQAGNGAHCRLKDRVAQLGNSRIHSTVDQQSAAVIMGRLQRNYLTWW